MGRIRVLSDRVANQIAAGEVVERPASVVKEMLENSLDAGAGSVRIEVESGGRRLIRITDDGCGMLRDDAMLAFERHATSKLREAADLNSIATLGFRGEAIPSIAAVSRFLLETRAPEEQTGSLVEVAGGRMLRSDEIARAPGTTITVRDLFFNVPARKKFLRSEQTELAHIASLTTHYSLAHPDKAFHLISGGSDLLRVNPVSTPRERLYQVFGAGILEDLIDLGEPQSELLLAETVPGAAREEETVTVKRRFTLRGFASRPQVQKANRNSIFIFVNRRLIRDKLLLHALNAAYYNLIPPGAFPFALLFLECDAEEVDVNVHPSKTEVRFRHQSFVHDFVRDAIRSRLIESRPAPAFRVSTQPQPAAALPYSEFSQQLENPAGELAPPMSDLPPPADPVRPEDGEYLPDFRLRPQMGPAPRLDFGAAPEAAAVSWPSAQPAARELKLRAPQSHGALPGLLDFDGAGAAPASLSGLRDLRPLGQIHESFIVAAGKDGLWIIDQHVAHERILFEKVLKQRASGRAEQQRLLLPLVLELTPAQQVEYARIAGELDALGFESEPFGPRTIVVKAAPAGIASGELEKVVFEILEIAETELRGRSLDELRRGIAASIACHAAIKINTPLDMAKMEWLLTGLNSTDCPMSCPHGRPIALRYGTREILRAFHRV